MGGPEAAAADGVVVRLGVRITGSTVTIDGAHLTHTTKVKFGKLAASFSVVSDSEVTATVPDGAVPAPITVATTGGSATSATSFTPTLSITSFSPALTGVGRNVSIQGIGFTPTSTVAFDGTTASAVTFVSSTRLKAKVPPGATTGRITVTNTAAPAGTVESSRDLTVYLADSRADFSNRQGRYGWYYGFYADPPQQDFTQMTVFATKTHPGDCVNCWEEQPGTYWTMIAKTSQHPNSTSTSGGRTPVNQWSVRRWVSDYAGTIRIDGLIGSDNPSGCGDGTAGHVIVDGTEVGLFTAPPGGGTSRYAAAGTVHVGSTVDFALDPGASDLCDGTTWTATITPDSGGGAF